MTKVVATQKIKIKHPKFGAPSISTILGPCVPFPQPGAPKSIIIFPRKPNVRIPENQLQTIPHPPLNLEDPSSKDPSKIKQDLTNGPLSKVQELLDTQV